MASIVAQNSRLVCIYSAEPWRCFVQNVRHGFVLFRSCHGDSSSQNRQQQYVRPKTDMLTKNPSGIPGQKGDIILELNKLIRGKTAYIGARHSLQSRIETLESVGCSLDDIQSHPDVLLLSEIEVIKRSVKLRKNQKNVIVDNLMNDGDTKPRKISTRNEKVLEMSNLLKCSARELSALAQKADISLDVGLKNIISRIRVFQQHGLTSDDIKKNMFILKGNMKKMERILHGIRSLGEDRSTVLSQEGVQLFIEAVMCLQKSYQAGKIDCQHQFLAKVFNVNVSCIKDLKYTNMGLETVIKKLVYLLHLGLDKRDILNHFYLLRHSIPKLEKGVIIAKEAGIDKITAVTLVNVVQHKYIPPSRGHSRNLTFIASLLDIPVAELKAANSTVRSVYATDRLVLRTNLEYLQGQGYSKEDIKQCVMVLGHEPETLVHYVETLPKRSEFQPFLEYFEDKVLMLNAVQYFIERDCNFNTTGGRLIH